MTDVNAGINVRINTEDALGQLRQLQAGISAFNQSVIGTNTTAVNKQQELIRTFAAQVESTKQFATGITNVETSVGRLSKAIDQGKLSLGQYFSYGMGASKTFGSIFQKQQKEIMALAEDRVKRLQTQYVQMGQSANGMTKALSVRPLQLFNADAAIGVQRAQLFNKVLADGSTHLVNWGKNTQWAGRQLMVGFSVPLTLFATAAGKAFMDLDKAMVQFRRVYGDSMTTAGETNQALEGIKGLANEYTKYGIAVKDTIELSAKAAAMGATGANLMAQTEQATRLSTLGQMDYQRALETTMTLNTAFGIQAKDLGDNINFLNAVENQTILSLDDMAEAIPIVASTIKGLGGDVQDLAVMMTAMREGGVSANIAANALKSGLASLINPTKAARTEAAQYGIDLEKLATENQNDLMGMITAVNSAMSTLTNFERKKLLERIFGKHRYNVLGTMFESLAKDGSQASKVMELAGSSTEELAALANKELGSIAESVSVKFTGAVERLKNAIAPIGEIFLRVATPVIDKVTEIVNWFNKLPDGMKTFAAVAAVAIGVIGPGLTMLIGLLANSAGNILKVINAIRNWANGFRVAGSSTEYLAAAELDAAAAAASLEGRTNSLTASLNAQRSAIAGLVSAYGTMSASANNAMLNVSQGFRIGKIKGFAGGRVGTVAGSGRKDSELVALTPGESVVTREGTRGNQGILAAINAGVKGFAAGRVGDVPPGPFGKVWHGATNVRQLDAVIQEVELAGGGLSNALNVLVSNLEGDTMSMSKLFDAMVKSGNADLKSIGEMHRSLARTDAPSAWGPAGNKAFLSAGRQGQVEAILKSVERFNLDPGKIQNLTSVHASHKTDATNKYGHRLWEPENVIPDAAATNTYIKQVGYQLKKVAESPAWPDLVAEGKKLGLSEEVLAKELQAIGQGVHPLTVQSHTALEAFATLDAQLRASTKAARTKLGTLTANGEYTAIAAAAGSRWIRTTGKQKSIDDVKNAYSGMSTMIGKRQADSLAMTSKLPDVTAKSAAVGQNMAIEAAKGLNTGVKKGAAIASPARAFIPVGERMAEGMIVGAQRAITGAEAAGYKAMRGYKPQRAAAPEPKAMGSGKLMGLLTIVDSITFALSFVPGQIGQLSQQIMLGTMAFQGVVMGVNALKGALATTRFASMFTPLIGGTGLAATALGALASPAGIAVAALGALGLIAWAVYKRYDDQKKAMENFGVSVKNSTATMQTFAQQFGFQQRFGNIQTTTTATDKGAGDRARSAQEYVRSNMESDNDFKQKIEAIKNNSVNQAEVALRQMFMHLIASGAPADVAKSIVEQMANEANKGNVFKGISDSLSKALDKKGEIRDVVQYVKDTMAPAYKQSADSAKKIAEQEKIIANARKDTKWVQSSSGYGMQQVLSEEATKQIAEARQRIAELSTESEQFKQNIGAVTGSVVQDLNILAANGMLTKDQFAQAFAVIQNSIQTTFGGDQQAQIGAYQQALAAAGASTEISAFKFQDAGVAAAALQAVMSGADPSTIIAALNSTTASANQTAAALINAANAALASPVGGGATKGGDFSSKYAAMENQMASLQKQAKSARSVGGGGGGGGRKPKGGGGGSSAPKKSKYDKKADQIAKANARLDIKEVKIDKSEPAKIQAALNKRFGGTTFTINGMKIALKNAEDIEYATKMIEETIEDINRKEIDPLNDKLEKVEKRQDEINHLIQTWQNKIDEINESYAKQIDPLQKISDQLAEQTSEIENQRDRALDGINIQIAALENQADAAEYAAEKQGAAIDDQIAKNNEYKDLIDKQIEAIDEQIEALESVSAINEIIAGQQQRQLDLASALSRGDAGAAAAAMVGAQAGNASDNAALQKTGLENQKKPLEDQSSSISNANDLLEKRREAIDKGVDALNRQLAALNQQKTVIENSYKVQLLAMSQESAALDARINKLRYSQGIAVKYWQDQIDSYAPELRDLDEEIYKLNLKIKQIEDAKIKPLEKQRDLLEDISDDVKTAISREKAGIEQKRKQLDYASKLNNAMKTLHDRAKAAAGAAGGIGKAIGGGGVSAVNNLKKKMAELKKQMDAMIFKAAVKMGMVVKTKSGALKIFETPEKAADWVEKHGGSKIKSTNEIKGEAKFKGKTYKGDFNTIASKIGSAMSKTEKKWVKVYTSLGVDANKKSVKITTRRDGGGTYYVTANGAIFRARGGLIPGGGGILPGFRGVTHGDSIPAMLRAGEGVTVSEALRNNKYETQRLLALNKAALSGNLASFYDNWAEPQFSFSSPVAVPVSAGGGDTIMNNYDLKVYAETNADPREIANAVMTTIQQAQNQQIRRR